MKIYIHGLHYQDYEDRGELYIITTKKMNEEDFMKFYDENYAGKSVKEDGVYLNMHPDQDNDGNEIMPTFVIDEEGINADIGYKYVKKGDEYSPDFKFFVKEVNVKENL